MAEQEKDHPDQAIDTPVPKKAVHQSHFKALQEEYNGEAEEELEDYVEGS